MIGTGIGTYEQAENTAPSSITFPWGLFSYFRSLYNFSYLASKDCIFKGSIIKGGSDGCIKAAWNGIDMEDMEIDDCMTCFLDGDELNHA
jgi:hypothetical protein